MSAWYIARENELLLDIDGGNQRLSQSDGTKLEMFFRRRLRDAVLDRLIKVDHIWIEPSITPGNFHVFVRLSGPMTLQRRLIWQSWLGSDLYRARADLMRADLSHLFPSLLILPKEIGYRKPDAVCGCSTKHDLNGVADLGFCETWKRFRGPSPWECFGAPRTPISGGSRPRLRWGVRLTFDEWGKL